MRTLASAVLVISGQPHERQAGPVRQPERQPLHHGEDEPGEQLTVLVEHRRRLLPHRRLHDGVVALHTGVADPRFFKMWISQSKLGFS